MGMARLAILTAIVVVAAVIVGCGPAKELPDEIPKGPEHTEKPGAVPTTSEPAAKAYLDKAVKAYTGGKPELVAKGAVNRLKLAGTLRDPGGNQAAAVPATRTIAAAWPDRFADTDERQTQGRTVVVSAYHHRPRLTVFENGIEGQPSNPVELELNLAADECGQHWMALLLPLTDPKAIVFDLHQQTLPQQTVQTLKLSLGKFPVYQLQFDAKTDALVRVEYTITEQGVIRRRHWSMTEHKLGPEGLLLPGKMECRWDNVVVEEWKVEKWEFPATIDDKDFAPPKK
jgi:hypothetical protein